MRYFFITQDVKLSGSIQYRDFDIKGGRHLFLKTDAQRLNDTTVLYLGGDGREARPDFLQRPVTMFSNRFRDILDAYEAELIFKDVVLIHKEQSLQYNYVQVLMDELEAVSEKTQYYPNQMPKTLILDKNKIGPHHLFLLAGRYRKDPIISLALAESLLRRNAVGLCLEEVEVE